ncbi:MAG: four helix bundle protein [Planctomycetota bacterium]|jgi:four helix bundle protein
MTTVKTFEDLACYRAARQFRRQVARFCRGLSKEETHRLKDQLLRASRSVTANVAEGYGRHHHQENAQFCRQARGSLTECLDHLNVASDEGYLSDEGYAGLRAQLQEAWKILNGYIAYLQRCADGGVPPTRLNFRTTAR